MDFISKLIIGTLAIIVTTLLLPGIQIDSALTALWVSLVLAFLNAILRPVLVLLTIPITLISMGLFLLVINAVMILLVAKLVPGFSVSGFWTALLFSIILSIVNTIFTNLNTQRDD